MANETKATLVAIVDDDELMRSALQGMLKSVGFPSQAFASAEEFLKSGQHQQTGCLIADIRMPGMSGLELQAKLNAEHCRIPTILSPLMATQNCVCKRCELAQSSSWRNRLTTKHCSTVFAGPLRAERNSEPASKHQEVCCGSF